MTLPRWLALAEGSDGGSIGDEPRRRRLSVVPHDPSQAASLSSPALIARLRLGDPAAFDELFTLTYAPLVRFANRLLHSLDAAEDVVMDVFRRVWERRASWEPDDVRVYLFGAVRNAAATVVRDRATRSDKLVQRAETAISPGMANPISSPDDTIETTDRLRALSEAIQTLPERQQLVFTLRRDQELTNAQVAAVLGIAVKTVEKDLTAAFKTLRTALAAYGDT